MGIAKLVSLEPASKINWHQEIVGGLINFMAIAYIIAVNPVILNAGGAGFPLAAAITATVLIIIIMTAVAGIWIKLPFVLAPGMGINAIVAYNLVLHDKLALPTVLGVIFFSSILLLLFSLTRVRQLIVHAIPSFLQIALGAGIGFFLLMIGLKNGGIIQANPNTLVSIGHFNLAIILTCAGFILAVVLFIRRKAYAFLLPIVVLTVIHAALHPDTLPTTWWEQPDFSLLFKADYGTALKLSVLPAILSLFIVNFFDATSTTMGLLAQIEVKDPQHKSTYLKRALVADSMGGVLASWLGVSPCVIFIESSAAVHSGARTGLTSLITASTCIPFLFLAPLVAVIPNMATAPILMVVGLIMLSNIRRIQVKNFEDILAASLTIVMMPLCFSITAGAIFGIISYVVLKLLLGKTSELSPALIIIAIVCCSWFGLT